MKNPHGVEPTLFMKNEIGNKDITCDSKYGPIFGDNWNGDLLIGDHCNIGNICYIHNDGTHAYECHLEHKSSLFVKTAGPGKKNKFKVLDYEVFTPERSFDMF